MRELLFKAFPLPLVLLATSIRAELPLLICLPGGTAPSRIESLLGPAVSPRKVIAFVRMKDLEQTLAIYPGAPVITSAAYLLYLAGYGVLLKGNTWS